jgi:hypothetical protein
MVGNDELMAAWLADLATTLDAIDRHGLPGSAISDLDSVISQLRDQATAFNVGMMRLGVCGTSIWPSRPAPEADAGGPVRDTAPIEMTPGHRRLAAVRPTISLLTGEHWQIWDGDGLRRQAAQERRQDRVGGWDEPPVGGVA